VDYVSHDYALCYGCRTCQLVCSLHHTGSFWPARSSIQTSRQPQHGTVRWSVDDSCDRCISEPAPLCVKYCSYDALTAIGETGEADSG
jgi:Fe-S-cluster-containing hydrogenase component 2